jgi:hypothetical protein
MRHGLRFFVSIFAIVLISCGAFPYRSKNTAQESDMGSNLSICGGGQAAQHVDVSPDSNRSKIGAQPRAPLRPTARQMPPELMNLSSRVEPRANTGPMRMPAPSGPLKQRQAASAPITGYQELPVELIQHIAGFMEPSGVVAFSSTNRHTGDALKQERAVALLLERLVSNDRHNPNALPAAFQAAYSAASSSHKTRDKLMPALCSSLRNMRADHAAAGVDQLLAITQELPVDQQRHWVKHMYTCVLAGQIAARSKVMAAWRALPRG